jgi:hypothetical protein
VAGGRAAVDDGQNLHWEWSSMCNCRLGTGLVLECGLHRCDCSSLGWAAAGRQAISASHASVAWRLQPGIHDCGFGETRTRAHARTHWAIHPNFTNLTGGLLEALID